MKAVNVDNHRAEDCHDGTDNCDLEEGTGDMGFDLNDYEGAEELPLLPSLLSLCSHPMLKQPGSHTIMNSRSSNATPLMRLGNYSVWLQALKDKKGLNLKGVLSVGVWKPQRQPKRAMEGTSPTK